jgi:hypothetical protein
VIRPKEEVASDRVLDQKSEEEEEEEEEEEPSSPLLPRSLPLAAVAYAVVAKGGVAIKAGVAR